MKEEYEHSKSIKRGKEFVTHLTGKHKKAKSEAIGKKMEGVKTSIGKVLRLHKGKE